MDKEFWVQKLTSRKFWVAVATAIFIIVSEGLGFNLDPDLYWKLVAIALGYIFGESITDVAKHYAEAEMLKQMDSEIVELTEKAEGTD